MILYFELVFCCCLGYMRQRQTNKADYPSSLAIVTRYRIASCIKRICARSINSALVSTLVRILTFSESQTANVLHFFKTTRKVMDGSF